MNTPMIPFLLFTGLGLSLALFALLIGHELFRRGDNDGPTLEPGDPVIYRKQKFSTCPGRRAEDVTPAPGGETYTYLVDKFWVVEDVMADGRVLVKTRTNKHHMLSPGDPHLRPAGLVERWRFRSRFPRLSAA